MPGVVAVLVAMLVVMLVVACGGDTVGEADTGDDVEEDAAGEDPVAEEPGPPAVVVEGGSVVRGTLVVGPRNLDVEAFAPDTCLYLEVDRERYALRPTMPSGEVGISFSLEPPDDLEAGQPVLMEVDDSGPMFVEVGVLARAGDEVAIDVSGVDPNEPGHLFYIGCDDAETLIIFQALADG